MQIVADRFIRVAGAWFDLASGARVRLHVTAVASRAEQVASATRCAAQSGLRHPLLNALLDFGALDASQWFEAYEDRGPAHAAAGIATAWLAHVVRFLEAHQVALDPPLATLAVRPVVPGPVCGPAIGIVLQPRAALEAVQEALSATHPAGACRIVVCGRPQSGLRTLALSAARAARLVGYLPIADASLARWPGLAPALAGRHLCVLSWDSSPGDVRAAVLSRLEAAGARRHVVLFLTRRAPGDEPAISLDPLSLAALTGMVYSDPTGETAAAQVLSAATASDGWPGVLLERLGGARPGTTFEPLFVRERAAVFSADRHPGAERRISSVLLSAPQRAARLAARGRHAHAERLLRRALRVLDARGSAAHAAACALTLGRLALDRGGTESAAAAFERARVLAPDGRAGSRATLALGQAWLLAARLREAEASFRTAQLAADALRDADAAAEASGGLAECLCLQGRAEEAAALPGMADTRTVPDLPAPLALARAAVALARGDVPGGVRAGRAALAAAVARRDARLIAGSHRLLGLALAAAGDHAQAAGVLDDGVALAREARLPIEALRLRAVLLTMTAPGARRRLAAHLQRAAGRAVPRLVQLEIAAACQDAGDESRAAAGTAPPVRLLLPGVPTPSPVAVLEDLLERGRAAADDRTALEEICAAVAARARAATVLVVTGPPEPRLLALHGRPWPAGTDAAARALATGRPVPAESVAEPRMAAEPIRYGGEVIAAVACRWTPGTPLEASCTASILRVAALAAAAHVRGLIDRAVEVQAAHVGAELAGESPAARALREAVARAARAPFPVLVQGESGSGKELVARAVHRLSARRDRRFCPVNCAALTEDLLEAELFGHARGAFTGAVGERAGLFEEADGGTLFLDEIGELSARAQAKLLRVLQDGEIRRVGESHPRRVDTRIVAATNRRLEQEAAAGRFRSDLRFRLDVVRIEVPPLRERPGDVALLAARFWAEASARVGSRATLSPEALAALSRYDWPGNVRELQNVIAWMAVHSPTRGRIGTSGLPAHLAHAGASAGSTFEAARLQFERRFVRAALATANGRRAQTAAALGVSRQGLAKMLRRLGIEN